MNFLYKTFENRSYLCFDVNLQLKDSQLETHNNKKTKKKEKKKNTT